MKSISIKTTVRPCGGAAKRRAVAAVLAGAVVAAVGPAFAAAAPAEQAVAGDSTPGQLEEIIVTGRKRNERLENIAEMVSVFTPQDIAAARIETVGDVARLTPGMYFSGDWSPSVSTLTVRGVTNNPNADAPVAFVVDGVAYGNSYLMGQELFDISQIEILKGPQGSLYGRNAIGGAINITTRRPTDTLSGYASGAIGNGGMSKIKAGISGPLMGDKLLGSVSVTRQKFDGLIMNDFLHEPVDFKSGGSARVRLLFTPTEALTADLSYTQISYDEGSTYWRAENVPASLGLPSGIIQSDFLTRADFDANMASGKFDYETSAGRLTAIASQQKVTVPRTVEIDFLPLSLTEVLTSPDTAKTSALELRMVSPDNQALRWSVGGFYQDQKIERAQNVYVNTNPNKDPALKTLVRALVVPTNQPNLLRSVFGEIEYDISPRFTASAGFRQDRDRRRDLVANLAQEFSATTPKVAVAYKPAAGTQVYALYSEGYRSGGFNSTAVFGRVYQPEKLKNYEVGYKTRSATGNFSFSGALYYQDYTQQQFYVFSTAAASQSLINSKKSRAQGVELEARYVPVKGLDLIASVNVVDTKISDFGTFRAFAGITEADINGKKLLYTPAHTVNLTAQYSWMAGAYEASARADFTARGRIYWGFDNVENQGPVNVVKTRVSVGKDKWTLSAYADNLFNERFDTFCFVGRFIGNANRINPCAGAEPRQYGAEIAIRF